MYITLAELKTRMGITDTSRDAELTQLLADTTAILTAWWKDYTSKQHTKQVTRCDICGGKIYLDYPNVTSVDSIAWTAYSWTLGTDYRILPPKNSCVWFKSETFYYSDRYFDLVYTAGYSTIPEDLKLVEFQMVKLLIGEGLNNGNSSWTKNVKTIKLWPKTVTHVDGSETTQLEKYGMSIKSILNSYAVPVLWWYC